MRKTLRIALLLPALIVAVSASASPFWNVRSFRTRGQADRFIAQRLAPGEPQASAVVVPMAARSGRNVHVVYVAESRFEDPNKVREVTIQRCTAGAVMTCAGTYAWMSAAGLQAVLLAVPSGDSMVIFERPIGASGVVDEEEEPAEN